MRTQPFWAFPPDGDMFSAEVEAGNHEFVKRMKISDGDEPTVLTRRRTQDARSRDELNRANLKPERTTGKSQAEPTHFSFSFSFSYSSSFFFFFLICFSSTIFR